MEIIQVSNKVVGGETVHGDSRNSEMSLLLHGQQPFWATHIVRLLVAPVHLAHAPFIPFLLLAFLPLEKHRITNLAILVFSE